MLDWLKSHKRLLSVGTAMVAGALQACSDPMCSKASFAFGFLTAALAGAGFISSDAHVQAGAPLIPTKN
jgi:hypothetical protein